MEDKADDGGQQKDGDAKDDGNLRIRVEGANLDLILRSKMVSSSADDALDWNHAYVEKGALRWCGKANVFSAPP